jgi:hypothetical protein
MGCCFPKPEKQDKLIWENKQNGKQKIENATND